MKVYHEGHPVPRSIPSSNLLRVSRQRMLVAGCKHLNNKHVFIVLGCLLVFVMCLPALGWNDQGHMTVAYVAYQRLTAATKARVDSLLQLNPYHSKWMAMIPAGTTPENTKMMLFMIAATWPDQIKSDPQYHNDGPNGGDRPNGPTSSQNIGYSDHL